MARFPSGIIPLPGDDVDDVRARLAQMLPEMDSHPIATSAPCMNPECTSAVDYLGTGPLTLYCSALCRNRASDLRRMIRDQLLLIETTLDQAHYRHDIPRQELRARAQLLRWWLIRLAPQDERPIA